MLAGCLFLWIGVPIGWLWIGSQVQGSGSLGTALMVTMVGIIASILVVVILLGRLNRLHEELQLRRRRTPPRTSALEVILVSSAGIAVILIRGGLRRVVGAPRSAEPEWQDAAAPETVRSAR